MPHSPADPPVRGDAVSGSPPCPACGASGAVRRSLGTTALWECAACGTWWNAEHRDDGHHHAYYHEEYALQTNSSSIDFERRRIARLPEQWRLIALLERYRPAPATVVDIGCDRGFFLDELRRRGYAVRGVEPSTIARHYCAAIGLHADEELPHATTQTEAITMWHVLEHLAQPHDDLATLRENLSVGGVVLIRVPDFGSLPARLLRRRWVWFQPENHCVHFSERGLRKLLERTGFAVEYATSQRPNTFLSAMMFVMADWIVQPVAGKHSSLRRYASVVYQWLTGVEIVVVARKPASS